MSTPLAETHETADGMRLFIPVHQFNFAAHPIRVSRVFRCCAGDATPEPRSPWRKLAGVITRYRAATPKQVGLSRSSSGHRSH